MKEEKVIHEISKNPSESVRVVLGEYHGKDIINVRVYFQPEGEERWIPTKKGVTLSVESIPELREAIEKAEKEWEKSLPEIA